MTAIDSSVSGLYVGTSSWSYTSWRPDFYPAGTKPPDFLRYYSQRFSTVELNSTAYRLPEKEQFASWAEQTADGFRFAPKLNGHSKARVGEFAERVALLGDRLGPVRVLVNAKRDDQLLAHLRDAFDPSVQVAFDFRHASWDGVEGVQCVNASEGPAGFRYIRLRKPPYSARDLKELAAKIRPLVDDRLEVYCYFMHEKEPTAPRYAEKLIALLK